MRQLLDAWWRAAAYCFYPQVIGLSLLPLLLCCVIGVGLGYWYYNDAVRWVQIQMDSWAITEMIWRGMSTIGLGGLKSVVAPLLVIVAVTPLMIVLCLLAVSLMMTPAMVKLVAARRFAHLQLRQGSNWWSSLVWGLGSFAWAVIALIVTLPLWLIPPLSLVIPPLIWGWLTYRVMTYDALADHADAQERKQILQEHRGMLIGMGLVCGYMASIPSLMWASGAVLAAAFVLLLPVAIWVYALIFAFSSLWYTHYALTALDQLRKRTPAGPGAQIGSQLVPEAQPAADPASTTAPTPALSEASANVSDVVIKRITP